jgi:amino acid transporter
MISRGRHRRDAHEGGRVGSSSRPGPRRSLVPGLDRRRLSPLPVLAQSVAAVAPCAAMATVPAIVVGATGSSALLAFAAATVVALLVSSCIRQFACRMGVAGGLYSFTARAVRPVAALASGWSALVGYAAVAMAAVLGTGLYVADLLVRAGVPGGAATPLAGAVAVVAGAVAWLVMHRGIRLSATVTLLVESVSIVLVVAVLVVLLLVTGPAARPAQAFSSALHPSSLGLGIVVAMSAFVGFESATTLGVEAHRPLRTVPQAVRWTVPGAAVVYLLAVSVQSLAGTAGHPAAAGVALTDLLAGHGLDGVSAVLDLAVAASFFSCTLASVNALVRVLFCMGREGVLPASLGRTHRRFRTPSAALGRAMPLVVGVPLLMLAAGARQEAMADLLTLSAFGYLGSYLAVCLGVPLFLRRIGEVTRSAVVVALLATAALLLVAGYALARAAVERPLVVGAFAAAPVAGLAIAGWSRWRAPSRLAAVGLYDEAGAEDIAVGARRGIAG